MTDPELARGVAERIHPTRSSGHARIKATEALILAAFARREDARRLEWFFRYVSDREPRLTSGLRYYQKSNEAGELIGGDSFRSAIDAAMGATYPMKETFAYLESPSEPASRADGFIGTPINPATFGHPLLSQAARDADASRAIPITPDTVVPFPCWLWAAHAQSWVRMEYQPYTGGGSMYQEKCWPFYHPDQPHAPTCRPTGGAT